MTLDTWKQRGTLIGIPYQGNHASAACRVHVRLSPQKSISMPSLPESCNIWKTIKFCQSKTYQNFKQKKHLLTGARLDCSI